MSLLDQLSFDDASTVKESSRGGESKITYKWPGPEAPLIVKFMKVPNSKIEEVYFKVSSFRYRAGENFQTAPTRQSLGLEGDPLSDKYWALMKARKEARDKAPPAALDAMTAQIELCKLSDGGYIYYIEPNSSQVKLLKIGKSVINTLFGRKAYGKVKEIKALTEEMMKDGGLSPFIVRDAEKNKTGWLKLYKTGEGMATEYHVEVHTTNQVVNISGKNHTVEVPTEFAMGDLSQLKLEDLPTVQQAEGKNVWETAELAEYIASGYTRIPARILERKPRDTDGADDEFANASGGPAPFIQTNPMDIPF